MDNNNQFGNNNSNPPEKQNDGNNGSPLYNFDISGNPFIRNNPQTGTNVNNYQPYIQNIPNKNYSNNNYVPPQNSYNEPFNRQYADAPVKKSSKGIYIVLIGVIICFAVIICLMFTLMGSMIDGGNKKSDSTDNNLFVSEVTSTGEPDIQTGTMEVRQTAVPAVTTEIAPEVVTVTVIVTVTEPVKQESSFQPYNYKVNNVGLVVYANAGFDSKPIDYISDRGTYTIVDQYQNWGKLESGGWINFDVASESGGVTYLGMGEVVTKKDPLNMRSAPDSDAKIITSIPKGTSVGVYESEFPDWYYVDYNGKSGFVSTKYISFDNFHITTIIDDCGYGTVATKKDPLNLRSEASENSSILTTIPKGTSIKLYSTIYDGWYSTSYNGKNGYVKAEYISFSDSSSTPSATYDTNILEYYGPGVVATEKDPLNVRSEPSTNASVVTTIPRHTTIDLYMTTYDGWYYTIYNGKSGYVSSQYISNVVPADDVQISSTAYINTKSDPLNLRKSASTSGAVITTIPKGTAVTVIEYGDSWCYVEWNGYKGYASTDYLLF